VKRRTDSALRRVRCVWQVEEEEPTTACPFCHVHGAETELECTACKNVIPYCIATGRRMVLGDWAHCPACRFPARASVFVKLISADRQCPMCHKEVQLSQVCPRPVAPSTGHRATGHEYPAAHRQRMSVSVALAAPGCTGALDSPCAYSSRVLIKGYSGVSLGLIFSQGGL
jgi:hypothetical protein